MRRRDNFHPALCTLLVLASCSQPDETRPSVLLLSIDTLRADHLSCYGYERETSPHIDAFAERAIRYADAVAPAPWTLPSHVAMLTGRHPRDVGIEDTRSKIPEDVPLLAELLEQAGYRTHALIDSRRSGFLGSARGFKRGFAEYRRPAAPEGAVSFDMARTVDEAIAWLGHSDAALPFFLFLHTKTVHSSNSEDPGVEVPYERPEPYRSRFLTGGELRFDWRTEGGEAGSPWLKEWNERLAKGDKRRPKALSPERINELIALYDAGIVYVDDHFGRLLAALTDLGLDGHTIVVVTSDHGEAFLEHRFLSHTEVYRSQLHVPLLLFDPRHEPGVVTAPVRLEDLVPTLLARVGVSLPDGITGRVLPARDDEAGPPRPRFAYSHIEQKPIYHAASLEDGAWKLIRHRTSGQRGFSTEVYAIRDDPREERPLQDAEIEERMERRLVEWLERPIDAGESIELDEEDLESLRALGYADLEGEEGS